MAEVTEYGYSTLRSFIQSSWKYVELQNTDGVAVIRLGIGDPRVTWTNEEGSQTLKLQIKISGADVTLPCTVAKTTIYDVATGGQPIASEIIEIVTLTQTIDELTVINDIQVPTIVG